jgi:signal transduction histidine kinase
MRSLQKTANMKNLLLKLKLWLRQFMLRWRNTDTRQQTFMGRSYDRLAAWLMRVTWKRFFLVSILLLIMGGLTAGLLDSLLRGEVPKPFVQVRTADHPKTRIVIEADADGVRVRSIDSADAIRQQAVKDAAQGVRDAAQAIRDAAQAAREGRPAPPMPPVPPAPPEPDMGEIVLEKNNIEVRVAKHGDLPDEIDQVIEEIKSGIADGASGNTPDITVNGGRNASALAEAVMPLVTLSITLMIMLKVILATQRKAEVKVAAAEEATEREALKRQVVEAKFTTMQAQVEPHFLFNTLASVDHLIEVDPPRASQMQKNLIQYLRAAMPHMRDHTSNMGREAQLVTSYLKILQFRMEERLSFSVDVPAGLHSAEIPPMMLLSLVENAIKHGLEPKPEGGRLDVKAEIAHGKLRVSVADTGLGFKPNGASTSGTGIGLANIRERLAMIYGGAASFSIGPNVGAGAQGGTLAVIEVPYKFTTAAA